MAASPLCRVAPPQEEEECPAGASHPHPLDQVNVCLSICLSVFTHRQWFSYKASHSALKLYNLCVHILKYTSTEYIYLNKCIFVHPAVFHH